MDRPHAHGLEGPREHPAPGGSPCPARKQQGPRAQRLRLQASTLSIPSAGDPPVWDLTPNPPHGPLPLLPGPCLERGLAGGPGTSFLLLNPKPNLLPILLPTGCQEPAASPYWHTLCPLSPTNISHLFRPSPHRNVCWLTQPPLGQACVGRLESLSSSPPNPPRSPGSVWFSRLGGRDPSLPRARLPRPYSLLRPGFS